MSKHVIAPFVGSRKDFPAHYRQFTTWVAARREHSAVHYLLTRNPDGHVTNAKKKALPEFSNNREDGRLAKECPAHVGSNNEPASGRYIERSSQLVILDASQDSGRNTL